MLKKKNVFRWGWLVLPLVTFIFFIPSILSVPVFSWDDRELIWENPVITQCLWKPMWTEAFLGNYMPVSMMIIAGLLRLHSSPDILHAAACIVHILNMCLLTLIFSRRHIHYWSIIFGASIFLLHPLQAEVLCWAAEMRTPLAYFFMLLALLLILTNTLRLCNYLLSGVLYMLALMTKPVAVVFPLLVFFFVPHRRTKGMNLFLLLSGLGAVVFSIVTYLFQREQGYISPVTDVPGIYRFPFSLALLGAYVAKVFFPFHLSISYPYPHSVRLWALWGLVLGGILMWSIFKYKVYRHKAFQSAWVGVITLFPVLQLIPFGQAPMADRYAYLFIPFFVVAICESIPLRILNYFKIIMIFFCITSTTLLYFRIQKWKDPVILFSDAVKEYPNHYLILNTLGVEYMNRNMDELSASHLNHAMKAAPLSPEIRYNLALLYLKTGRTQQARSLVQQNVLNLNYHFKSRLLYAELLNLEGKYNEAQKWAEECLNHQPYSPRAWYVYGNVLMGLKKDTEALAAFTRAVELMPGMADFHFRRGISLCRLLKWKEGLQEINRAISLSPEVGEFYFWRGMALRETGMNPCSDFQKAAALKYPPALKILEKGTCP